MGTFDKGWTATPHGLDWCHCLTIPRELTLGADGLLRQLPVAELDALRGEGQALAAERPVTLAEHIANVVVPKVMGTGSLVLDGALELAFDGRVLALRFLDEEAAAGRPERKILLDGVDDLRVVVDTSAVEVFVNGGEHVFASRWFPVADELTVATTFQTEGAQAYPLENAMAGAFA